MTAPGRPPNPAKRRPNLGKQEVKVVHNVRGENPVEGIERTPTEEGGFAQEAAAASMVGLGEDEADSR